MNNEQERWVWKQSGAGIERKFHKKFKFLIGKYLRVHKKSNLQSRKGIPGITTRNKASRDVHDVHLSQDAKLLINLIPTPIKPTKRRKVNNLTTKIP